MEFLRITDGNTKRYRITNVIFREGDGIQNLLQELEERFFISFHFILFDIHNCYNSNTWTSHNIYYIIAKNPFAKA
jgi:hypothetical protein